MNPVQPWTPAETAHLIRTWDIFRRQGVRQKVAIARLAAALKRSVSSVRHKVYYERLPARMPLDNGRSRERKVAVCENSD